MDRAHGREQCNNAEHLTSTHMIEKMGIKLYTTEETADILGVTKTTVKSMTADGRLSPARMGKYNYFSEEMIKAYINGERPQTKPGWPSYQRKLVAYKNKEKQEQADNTETKPQ